MRIVASAGFPADTQRPLCFARATLLFRARSHRGVLLCTVRAPNYDYAGQSASRAYQRHREECSCVFQWLFLMRLFACHRLGAIRPQRLRKLKQKAKRDACWVLRTDEASHAMSGPLACSHAPASAPVFGCIYTRIVNFHDIMGVLLRRRARGQRRRPSPYAQLCLGNAPPRRGCTRRCPFPHTWHIKAQASRRRMSVRVAPALACSVP